MTHITEPSVYTLDIEDQNGMVRQYGFHLGTDRRIALSEAEPRALWHINNGAKSAALKFEKRAIRYWDFRDLSD